MRKEVNRHDKCLQYVHLPSSWVSSLERLVRTRYSLHTAWIFSTACLRVAAWIFSTARLRIAARRLARQVRNAAWIRSTASIRPSARRLAR